MSRRYLFIAAAACLSLASAGLAPAVACTGSMQYQAPEPDKPVIFYKDLTDQQREQIDKWASDFRDIQKDLLSRAQQKQIGWDDAKTQFRAYMESAGVDLEFRAIVETFDGMLCGSGPVEIQIPPVPNTYELGAGLEVRVKGRYKATGKTGTGLLSYLFAKAATFGQ